MTRFEERKKKVTKSVVVGLNTEKKTKKQEGSKLYIICQAS